MLVAHVAIRCPSTDAHRRQRWSRCLGVGAVLGIFRTFFRLFNDGVVDDALEWDEYDAFEVGWQAMSPSNCERRESEDTLVIEPSSQKVFQVVIDMALFVVDL